MTKENFISRPKTKPAETLKGKMNKWNNGYVEFIPSGTRESNRTMLKQLGNSSFYKSEGTKESSYSLHLNVDAKDCADPVAALHEQFKLLTAGEQKQMPQLPKGEGRMLFDNGSSLKVWLNSEKGEVCILTRLQCGSQIERELLQAQAAMNVALGRHRGEIISNSNNK